MISPIALMKLAKGSIGVEQLAELLSALGMEVEFQELSEGQRPTHFQQLAQMAVQPGAQVMMIRGRHRDGDAVASIFVALPRKKVVDGKSEKALTSGGRALEAPGEPQSL